MALLLYGIRSISWYLISVLFEYCTILFFLYLYTTTTGTGCYYYKNYKHDVSNMTTSLSLPPSPPLPLLPSLQGATIWKDPNAIGWEHKAVYFFKLEYSAVQKCTRYVRTYAHTIIIYVYVILWRPVIHEWSVLIGHEGVARVVYQS